VDRVFGQRDDGVFEVEQGARVDLERNVEVDRAATALLWVEVDLPELTERIGLDEMSLVVDVKTVINGVIFELGNVASDVNDRHLDQV